MKKLISSDEAPECAKQITKPCSDCPWARHALRGWLGSATPEQWLQAAHGEVKVPCHALKGPQCAGLAIYRSNVCKKPRDRSILTLPADREAVFATPSEFRHHHTTTKENP